MNKRKKNNSKKELLIYLSVTLIIVIAIGFTFAYFMANVIGNDESSTIISVSENLEIVYNGTNAIVGNIEFPEDSITKTFTVTNTGDENIDGYNILFTELENTFVSKSDLVYNLTCTSYINYGKSNQAVSGSCSGKNETIVPSVNGTILNGSPINPGITHVYLLTIIYKLTNNDQTINYDAVFSSKIIVESTTQE